MRLLPRVGAHFLDKTVACR